MSAGLGATRTTLVFGDDEHALTQVAATTGLGYVFPSGVAVRAALGAVVDGAMATDPELDLGPGTVVAFGASQPWRRGPWFATGSITLAGSYVQTRRRSGGGGAITALDARAGVTAGRSFGPVAPYVLARGFGGPVFWDPGVGDTRTGTDAHHVQLGAGLAITIDAVAIVVDVSALGEQSASVGIALRR